MFVSIVVVAAAAGAVRLNVTPLWRDTEFRAKCFLFRGGQICFDFNVPFSSEKELCLTR